MLELCDCLNYCGDDPNIGIGAAAPCESKRNNGTATERRRRADTLAKEMGYSDALDALEAMRK